MRIIFNRKNKEIEKLTRLLQEKDDYILRLENELGLRRVDDEYKRMGGKEYVDTRDFYRDDMKTRFEGYTAGIKSGVFTINEVKKFEGLPPLPHGDKRNLTEEDMALLRDIQNQKIHTTGN